MTAANVPDGFRAHVPWLSVTLIPLTWAMAYDLLFGSGLQSLQAYWLIFCLLTIAYAALFTASAVVFGLPLTPRPVAAPAAVLALLLAAEVLGPFLTLTAISVLPVCLHRVPMRPWRFVFVTGTALVAVLLLGNLRRVPSLDRMIGHLLFGGGLWYTLVPLMIAFPIAGAWNRRLLRKAAWSGVLEDERLRRRETEREGQGAGPLSPQDGGAA